MFKIKRTFGHHVDFLKDWDTDWIAAFSSEGVAMTFKRRKIAEGAVKYLEHRLPNEHSTGDTFTYEVI